MLLLKLILYVYAVFVKMKFCFYVDNAVTEIDVHSKFEDLTGRAPSSAQTSDVPVGELNNPSANIPLVAVKV
jgi:hypothetical protein